MKRTQTVFLLTALTLCATPTFAQFRQVAKQAKNLTQLEQAVQRAALRRVHGKNVVRAWVPSSFVPGQQIGVTGALYPSKITAANVSFAYQVQNNPQLTALEIGTRFLTGGNGVPPTGKAYYTDQSSLAQDLNTFYQGQGVARLEGNRTVKLYALPVDGILYKPDGYKEAVVLNSNDYFVVYDIDSHSGKLVENTPENLAFYSRPGQPRAFEDVVDFGNQTYHIAQGEPEFPATETSQVQPQTGRLPQTATQAHKPNIFMGEREPAPLSPEEFAGHSQTSWAGPEDEYDHVPALRHRARVAGENDLEKITGQYSGYVSPIFQAEPTTQIQPAEQTDARKVTQALESNRVAMARMRKQGAYEDVWSAMDGAKLYTSQRRLGRDLSDFYNENAPRVYHKINHQEGFIYEIPVNGIVYQPEGSHPVEINPDTYVFFYEEQTGGMLLKREELDNWFDLIQPQ